MRRNSKAPRGTLIFCSCVLAGPTVYCILNGWPERLDLNAFAPLLATGAVLGVAHLILRPLLRIITAPLGCLTLGLSGTAIDVALIYLSARFVQGFHVPDLLYALLTALLINAVTAFVGARR